MCFVAGEDPLFELACFLSPSVSVLLALLAERVDHVCQVVVELPSHVQVIEDLFVLLVCHVESLQSVLPGLARALSLPRAQECRVGFRQLG
jgi:hypothetical protein